MQRVAQVTGARYYLREPFARLVITTDAPSLEVDALSDTIVIPGGFNSTGLRINGVAQGDGQQLPALGVPNTFTYALGPGVKTLELIEGPTANVPVGGQTRATPINAFRVPLGYSYSVVMPTAPAKRVVVIGDSIAVGDEITAGPEASSTYQGSFLRMRESLLSGSGPLAGARLILAAAGGLRWFDIAKDAATITSNIDLLVAQCDGTSLNVVHTELGTNDYGGVTGTISLASFTSYLQAWWAEAIARLPSNTRFVIQTPPTRQNEAIANTAGMTLAQVRTALANIATLYPTRVNGVISGPSIISYPGSFAADLLHPNSIGQAQQAAGIQTNYNVLGLGY